MRLYGRRFAKKFVEKRLKTRVELRDAVVWEIDETNQLVKVRILGSNELIYAIYPQNWYNRPSWLKEGNAVILRHKEGTRGFVEIIGEGRAIPQAVSGSIVPYTGEALPDAILTGLEMTEMTPESMYVKVSSGTYRINETNYAFVSSDNLITMDSPAPMIMGTDPEYLGASYQVIPIAASPSTSGEFRYDGVFIGTDETLDYVSGETSEEPEKPTLPANHLLVGSYIFVRFGMTEVDQSDIGAEWVAATRAKIDFTQSGSYWSTISGEDASYMEYSLTESYPEIGVTVTLKDQWDQPMSATGYYMTLEIDSGTGSVYSASSGWSTTSVSQAMTGASYYFKYKRDQTGAERSVVLKASLSGTPKMEGYSFLPLMSSASGILCPYGA